MPKKKEELEEEFSEGSKESDIKENKEEKKEFTIEDLPGVGPKGAEKLRAAGYTELMNIAAGSPGEIAAACDIGDLTAQKIILAAREKMDIGFKTAAEVMKRREDIGRITTGSKELDKLIGGGVETRSITEAFGPFGSGKSQLGFQLAVNVQLPKGKGGLNGRCLFIDTEATFRPDRIAQIAEAAGIDKNKVLKNIFVARAFNADHQIILVEKAGEMIKENDIKLIIVDSITSHFRSEFTGRGELAGRQQKLNKHIHALQKLADIHNVAVYITNQVMANPALMFGDPTTAVGGHIIAHACLTGDALIQLADGKIIQIKDVDDREDFSCIDFKKLKINKSNCNAKFIRHDIKEVYEIDTGNKISASPLHRFFKLDGFEIKEVLAKEIREGDWLAHIDSISFDGEIQKLPEIEMDEMIILNKAGSNLIKDELKRIGLTRKTLCQNLYINPRQFRRVLNQNFPTNIKNIQKMLELGMDYEIMDYTEPYTSHKHGNISIPNMLTTELAQVVGYLIGDGNIEKHGIRFRDERVDVLEFYRDILENLFKIDGKISKIKNKNCYELRLNSTAMVDLFKKLKNDLFGYVSKSPKDVVRAFIRGFADAEGYVSKNRPRIQIAQKDEMILKFIQLLLLRFGIRSQIRSRCTLMIDGRDVEKYSKEIGMTAKEKKSLLKKWEVYCRNTFTHEMIPVDRKIVWSLIKSCHLCPSKLIRSGPNKYKYIHRNELSTVVNALKNIEINDNEIKKRISFLDNLLKSNIRFERVKKIRKMKNDQPLFDLSIPKFKNYIANGFVVHNSTYRLYLRKGKQNKRIARLIDSPNLPEGEAVFSLSEKGIED